MFSESATLYDLIYSSFKNYEAETDQLFALLSRVRPGLRTVLDVACGTGEHARLLRERHSLEVDGVDLDPAFVQIAQAKNPTGRFIHGDMCEFDFGRTYDAVMCLFSSIGYVRTVERVTQAIARFRAHTAPGGAIVVEPWFPPGVMTDGFRSTHVGEREGVRVERRSWTEVEGRRSRIHFDYDINDHGRIQHAHEVHELGLFTTDEMRGAFEANGLEVEYDPHGLIGRGLYVARVPDLRTGR
jgi:SAM-dependent methyltransferase